MRWAVVAVVVALAAVVAANAALLGYGADRRDPVGQLSPVGPVHVQVHVPKAPASNAGEREDD